MNEDQLPDGWSAGAAGYEEWFAGFTGLYVDVTLDRLGVGAGTALIDVAAGSGAASIRAAERGATVTAVDFAPGMVDVVAERFTRGAHSACSALQMDGQSLQLPDDAFDAGLSMFGLMFFPDPALGLSELARVTRCGGVIAIATWDLADYPMQRLIAGALEVAVPGIGDVPRPPPTWAPLGTPDGLRALLERAGLLDVEVEQVPRRWHFADPAGFLRGMPDWSSPARPLFEALPPERIDDASAAFADLVAAEGGTTDGEGIVMSALVATGTVPDRQG